MMDWLALPLSLMGFAALALAMHRHHRQVWGRDPSRRARILLRLAGAAGLGSSFAACVAGSGWLVAPALWLGLLSLAGIAVAVALACRPSSRRSGIDPGQTPRAAMR